MIDPSCPYLIEIGNNVTLARGVTILAHDASLKQHLGIVKLGKVVIGNNVFIGANSTILCGVTIGDNCIIGAGSVVCHDCEENSVYAGNPAHFICTLDHYLEKHKRNSSVKPYYNFDFRFGDNGIENRKIIVSDLCKSKIGYGETFDKK